MYIYIYIYIEKEQVLHCFQIVTFLKLGICIYTIYIYFFVHS